MKANGARAPRLPSARELVFDAPQTMNGLVLLSRLPDASAALVVFDPQYRSVLDEMQYGNEGSRQKERAKLSAMTPFMIERFVREIARALRGSGHLAMWVDKYLLAEGRHLRFLAAAPELKLVDLIHWNKLRPGMGKRARCRSEYLVVAQKPPIRAQGIWTDHRLDDSWLESADRSEHAHAKPHQLTERLVRAVTKRGDLVVDPCAGAYGVLEACRASGRRFVGCDLLEVPE